MLHAPSTLQILLGIDTVRDIPAAPWTAARAKTERPDVTVRHAGREYPGLVTGGRFARVTIWRGPQDWQVWEWSWPALARSLNSGKPLAT